MKVLGIETSCDETAAAVAELLPSGEGRILASCVRSQIAEHAAYGGVVPEIAARAHVEALDGLVRQALAEAKLTLAEVDAVAATAGPGLMGGLLAGLTTGKVLALAAGKPFIPVNHLEGHALTARLTDNVAFPYLLLLVSGGHTQIILAEAVGRYRRLGTTLDDALGECFDKTAKLLGLGYPGGPAVERAARGGQKTGAEKTGGEETLSLPRPLKGAAGCDFSFSGLKTAVRRAAQRQAEQNAASGKKNLNTQGLTVQNIADICAAFEAAVADIVTDRLENAFALYDKAAAGKARRGRPALVAAGGVAANRSLRAALEGLCARRGFAFIAPPAHLCSDNAAMIAWAGAERLRAGLAGAEHQAEAMSFAARPRWPLDTAAEAKIGSGRKGAKA